MQIGAAAAMAGGVALGEHPQQRLEGRFVQHGIGHRPAQKLEQRGLIPFPTGHLGDDLLRQHVQRCLRNLQCVQLTAAHGVEQRGGSGA